MKKILAVVFVCLSILLLTGYSSAQSTVEKKQFHWGIESWELGKHTWSIQFEENKPVKITKIQGYLTAGPQPNHKPDDKLVRQTLASLTYPGNNLNGDVKIIETPKTKANHSVDRNLIALNVKQTGAETKMMPIDLEYPDGLVVPDNILQFITDNQSYRYDENKGSYVSQDEFDSINVEVHLIVYYDVKK